jgi:alpha-tubulin suppressor-like RCC1 family protein
MIGIAARRLPRLLGAILAASLALSCSDAGLDDTTAQDNSLSGRAGGEAATFANGGYHVCAVARRGVKCWGRNTDGQATPPAFRNLRQLSSGRIHTCALDDDGVKCWGNNADGQTRVPALRNPRHVSAGRAHTCAVDEAGVKCWGSNVDGETNVPALRNPRSVVAGYRHGCALDDDGVKCWGSNSDGQTRVPALRNPRQVTVGRAHTCALDDDGVKCWGSNTEGQSTVPPLRRPREISSSYAHTCALDDDGLKCWGSNTEGQTTVPPLRNPQQVSLGYFHTCAVDADAIACWGRSSDGQVTVPADAELVGRHACLPANRGVRCVGDNERGQLGVGSDDDRGIAITTATPVDLGPTFDSPLKVDTGRAFGCALSRGGAVKCWGYNSRGQLGLGDTRDRGIRPGEMGDNLPELRFDGQQPMSAIEVGATHSCALSREGEIFCWGAGSAGQLGTEATEDVGTASGPTRPRLKAGLVFRGLALGRSHTCGLTTEGAVYCFGSNDAGQLGLGRPGSIGDRPGTMGDAMEPVKLGDGFRAKTIASGDRHVCALSDAGQVKCWGAGAGGELGLEDARDRGTSADELGAALPELDLGHGQRVQSLHCGARHCCARMVQNTMKCWGDNSEGQLGLGDVAARGKTPGSMGDSLLFVLTPPHEAVLSIELDADRTCARTTSGLRCWGRNRAGELGYGDRQARGGTLTTVPRLLSPLGI